MGRPKRVKSRDLKEGMLVSIPVRLVHGYNEKAVAESEYCEVVSVNGGMYDNFAKFGQVVIYSENFAPIIIDGATELEVAR